MATNSGTSYDSVAGREFIRGKEVSYGRINDPTYFAYNCELDPEDEKKVFEKDSEEIWRKYIPSLPYFPSKRYIPSQLAMAEGSPASKLLAKRLIFCYWPNASDTQSFLDADLVEQIEVEAKDFPSYEELKDIPCYMGLDLSKTTDTSAISLCWKFPKTDKVGERFFIDTEIYVPKNIVGNGENKNVPWEKWSKQNFVKISKGNTIKYSDIVDRMLDLMSKFKIKAVTSDTYGRRDLIDQAEDKNFEIYDEKPVKSSKHKLLWVFHKQNYYRNTHVKENCLLYTSPSPRD